MKVDQAREPKRACTHAKGKSLAATLVVTHADSTDDGMFGTSVDLAKDLDIELAAESSTYPSVEEDNFSLDPEMMGLLFVCGWGLLNKNLFSDLRVSCIVVQHFVSIAQQMTIDVLDDSAVEGNIYIA